MCNTKAVAGLCVGENTWTFRDSQQTTKQRFHCISHRWLPSSDVVLAEATRRLGLAEARPSAQFLQIVDSWSAVFGKKFVEFVDQCGIIMDSFQIS